MRDGAAGPDFRKDPVFLVLPIGGNDDADRATDRLRGRIAEQTFGGPVPRNGLEASCRRSSRYRATSAVREKRNLSPSAIVL
jgi:hypothetical protein